MKRRSSMRSGKSIKSLINTPGRRKLEELRAALRVGELSGFVENFDPEEFKQRMRARLAK